MLFPDLFTFQKMVGQDMWDFIVTAVESQGAHFPLTRRQINNYRKGRHGPRHSKLMAVGEKLGIDNFELLLSELEELYRDNMRPLEIWESVFLGVEKGAGETPLWVREARALIQFSLAVEERFNASDFIGVSEILLRQEVCHSSFDDLLDFIRSSNLTDPQDFRIALRPFCLENLVYIMACFELDDFATKKEGISVVERLSPVWNGKKFERPVERFLAELREAKGFRSDKDVGKFLLNRADGEPWDEDNAEREAKKWKKQGRIPWARIKRWSREIESIDSYSLSRNITFVNVLQSVFSSLGQLEKVLPYTSRRQFFIGVPELVARARVLTQSSSESSGRSPSSRDCQ